MIKMFLIALVNNKNPNPLTNAFLSDIFFKKDAKMVAQQSQCKKVKNFSIFKFHVNPANGCVLNVTTGSYTCPVKIKSSSLQGPSISTSLK